jgi:hypothetical protein
MVRAAMRLYLGFLAPLSMTCLLGCAVGVAAEGDGEPPGEDASPPPVTGNHDAASNVGWDAGTQQPTQTDDAGPPVTFDASTSGCTGTTGTLVTYDFTGQPGNQASTGASATMAGLTAASMTRASTITATAGTNSINGSNWAKSGIDTTRYFTFTLTPGSCALDITSLSIDTKSSTTGPVSGAIATSEDSFATTTAFTPGTAAKVSLSVSGATKPVEVRIYGYSASGSTGTFRIENTLSAAGSLN